MRNHRTLARLINRTSLSTIKLIASNYKTNEDLKRWVSDCFRFLNVEDNGNCWREQFFDLQLSQNDNKAAMSRILNAAILRWEEI